MIDVPAQNPWLVGPPNLGMMLGTVVYTCHPSIRQLGHKNCKVEVSLCYIANARPSKAMYLDHVSNLPNWLGYQLGVGSAG